ncbi:MAG: protease modulator HflC [Planctomycetota bacterium]
MADSDRVLHAVPGAPRRALVRVAAVAVALALVSAMGGGVYMLDTAEQAVVLQFGRPVGDPVVEPGLHFKMPFVQEVVRFDKRIIPWDGSPDEIPTKGRELIFVDTTARWRIADPLQFLKSVHDESRAQSRLDDILDSVVRDTVSSHDLVELVRSADWNVTPADLEEEAGGTDNQQDLLRKIAIGREGIENAILTEARKSMPALGIELVDIRIKRLNYVKTVQEQVFQRMIAERQRIAAQFRSEGEGEASRIRGEASLALATVRSDAKRQAETVRGTADAEASRIFAQSYGKDPSFFGFVRSLESYRKSLGDRALLVLGGDGGYFDALRAAGKD